VYGQNGDTLDPLRASHGDIAVPSLDLENSENAFKSEISGANSIKLLVKEWTTFKRLLVQKFPTAKTLSVSSVCVPLFIHDAIRSATCFVAILGQSVENYKASGFLVEVSNGLCSVSVLIH